jgi:hypothetical protein
MYTTTVSSPERDEAFIEEKGLLDSQLKYELQPERGARISSFWTRILAISISLNVLWLVLSVFKPAHVGYENVISKYGMSKFSSLLKNGLLILLL